MLLKSSHPSERLTVDEDDNDCAAAWILLCANIHQSDAPTHHVGSRRQAGLSPVRGLSRRPHSSAIELSVHKITAYDIYSSKNDDADSSA